MSIRELEEVGLARMDDEEIRTFLDNHPAGVLGLPSEGAPYLLPLSYGYDGGPELLFTYVLGTESRKERLSDSADAARFLVYDATSPFVWQSVLLTGRVSEVPEDEWDEYDEVLGEAWTPDLFARAELTRGVKVYRFEIDEQSGIKHTGLPPALEEDA